MAKQRESFNSSSCVTQTSEDHRIAGSAEEENRRGKGGSCRQIASAAAFAMRSLDGNKKEGKGGGRAQLKAFES